MKFEITVEEVDAIKKYKDDKYMIINQFLTNDVESDIELLSSGGNFCEYTKESVVQNIEIIKKTYEIMLKNFYNNSPEDWTFYRGTNIAEIDKLKINPDINKFISTTPDIEKAKSQFSNNWSRPAVIQIEGAADIPYLKLNEVLNTSDDEIIIAPFTKVVSIEEIEDNQESLKMYKIVLENQKFEELSETEQTDLYRFLIENADNANERLNACVELDEENSIHYENIRKLEQLLAKHNLSMEQDGYEADTTESEKQSNLDDVARINMELDSLKSTATKVFNIRQENCKFIWEWKNKFIRYIISECRKIDLKYSKKMDEEIKVENVELEVKEILDDEVNKVKEECLENIEVVNTLLDNIKNLISKQQNHARIAEEMNAHYKALNNAFEMKNYAEELSALVKAIANKVNNLTKKDEEQLEKISQTNLQISTLLNYLNNARAAIGKKITRFDEINIIEENELKKEIAETIKNIRCEAELKKLNDDIDIIEDKSYFRKLIDRFTGRNKLDAVMLEQIQVRQIAIKKTFRAKMPLAYNYSIHELIAEIEMFIKENIDDELVIEDVNALRKIETVLKKNFVIIDSKVVSIIDRKTGKNLPLASKELTKKEIIEIDTYRFLNRYGYDKIIKNNEPEYQDTLAHEIKRIVDYIKTSNII